MAFATDDEQPVQPAPVPAVQDVPTYQSSIVQTADTPLSSILQYAEGSPTTVDYYSQILGPDQAPRVFSPESSSAAQHYHEIKGLRVLFNDGFDPQNVPDQNSFEIEGTITFTPGTVIPNTGDVVAGDFGDGREYLASVGLVRPLSVTLQTGYTAPIRIIHLQEPLVKRELLSRVKRRSVFRQELLTMNRNPVISEVINDYISESQLIMARLKAQWCRQFISKDTQFILVPEQSQLTHDRFITMAVLRVFGVWDNSELRHMYNPSMDSHGVFAARSLWNVIIDGDELSGNQIFKRAGLGTTQLLRTHPTMRPLFYSAIQRIVVPKDNPYDVDDETTLRKFQGLVAFTDKTNNPITSALLGDAPETPPSGETPVFVDTALQTLVPIKPVVVDDYYVLSSAFYEGRLTEMSQLEYLVTMMVQGKDIHYEDVLPLLRAAGTWDPLERFYYHPLLVMLIIYLQRRVYS